jgi:hypothetical protein
MRAMILVLMTATVAACAHGAPADETTANDDAGASYPDVTSFCNGYGQAQCSTAVMSACGIQSGTRCTSAAASACVASQPQGTTYVPANAGACISLVEQTYSSTTITAAQLRALATACGTKVFSGPGQARAQCQTDYDCSSQSGLSCIIPFGATAGKCYAPTAVQAGGSCASESAVCADGSYCDPMSQVCQIDAAAGIGCSAGYNQCADGLACVGAGPFATCAAKYTDGHPCTLDTDCSGALCDKASSQAEGTCASEITLTPLDAACTPLRGQ